MEPTQSLREAIDSLTVPRTDPLSLMLAERSDGTPGRSAGTGYDLASRETSVLVQYTCESLPPPDAEAGRDFHLVRELRLLVRSQPGRERRQCPRLLSELLREREWQLAGDGA